MGLDHILYFFHGLVLCQILCFMTKTIQFEVFHYSAPSFGFIRSILLNIRRNLVKCVSYFRIQSVRTTINCGPTNYKPRAVISNKRIPWQTKISMSDSHKNDCHNSHKSLKLMFSWDDICYGSQTFGRPINIHAIRRFVHYWLRQVLLYQKGEILQEAFPLCLPLLSFSKILNSQ